MFGGGQRSSWPGSGRTDGIESGAEKAELEQLDLGSETGMPESMKRNKHQIARGERDREHHNVTITNAHFVGGYLQLAAVRAAVNSAILTRR